MRLLPFVSAALLAAGLGAPLSGCDSHTGGPDETVPPLEIAAELIGPSDPVRDTLRVRVTVLNSPNPATAWVQGAWLDGEPVEYDWIQVDERTVDVAVYVSEKEGAPEFVVEAVDRFEADGGQISVNRTARATVRPTIERTYWQRLVTGTAPYESDLGAVFHDGRGTLWVWLTEYRSSFWSSPNGISFTQRRYGFEKFLATDGGDLWIQRTDGLDYLSLVDLATGEVREEYTWGVGIAYIRAGDAHNGAFYGIEGSGQYLLYVQAGEVEPIADAPYAYSPTSGSLLGYLISADGTHWLATSDHGVLRNDGSGWTSTAGLASPHVRVLAEGPGGSVWAMAEADRCVVAEWDGGAWAERAVFDRDHSDRCGTFAVAATGAVWRGATFGVEFGRVTGGIERSKGGVIDRRYRAETAASMLVLEGTVWAATGYGLREVRDYESEGS